MAAREITVLGTDRERRRHRDVRQAEARERAAHEVAAGLGRGDRLVHVEVEHRAARVLALQVVLTLERLERVVREVDGQLRGVRVVRIRGRACLQDAGEALAVLLGEAVGRALGRRRLEVVHVVRLLLELDEAGANMVEQAQRKGMAPVRRDVLPVAREVADHLVDAVDADRREVIAQRAEIALRVREETLVDVALDDLALDLEARLRKLEQIVEATQKPLLVILEEEAQTRAVDRHHAERARLLRGAEEAVAALEQLAQVELQAAAHRADHVGLELGVDEVLEVRQTVARRHVEEPHRIGAVPVEVRRDVVINYQTVQVNYKHHALTHQMEYHIF